MDFPLPQLLPDMPQFPTHPTSYSFSPSLNKNIITKIMVNQTTIKQTKEKLKQYKRRTNSFCIGLLFLGMVSAFECGWLINSATLYWRKLTPLSYKILIVNSFLVGCETLGLLSFLVLEFLYGLNIYIGLCVLPESMWIHMSIIPVVSGRHCFLGVIYHLCLMYTILPSPLLCRSLSLEGKVDEDLPFRTHCFKVSHFLCIFQLWVSVINHILK